MALKAGILALRETCQSQGQRQIDRDRLAETETETDRQREKVTDTDRQTQIGRDKNRDRDRQVRHRISCITRLNDPVAVGHIAHPCKCASTTAIKIALLKVLR